MNESLLYIFSATHLFKKPLQVPSAAEKILSWDLPLRSSSCRGGEGKTNEQRRPVRELRFSSERTQRGERLPREGRACRTGNSMCKVVKHELASE